MWPVILMVDPRNCFQVTLIKCSHLSTLKRETEEGSKHETATIHAAAAKSLQSCLTLCDPRDSSPPGSAVPGILQARTLEWVAISFSNAWKWKVKVKSLGRVWLLSDPMDCSLPGSSVHGIFQARVLEWGAIAFSNVCRSFEVSNLSAKLCGFVQRSVLFSSVRTMTEMSLMYFVAYTIVLF